MNETFKMNDSQKKHLLESLKKGIRYDGRKPDEFRKIEIEYGISDSAEGSARVRIGETEVLAGVKMSIEKPYPDSPDKGSLMVGAELLPLSSPNFEPGPPGIQAIEVARVVDRGIRESKAIDLKKLCVEEGEKVWIIMIDVCTINDAGNLFDAASIAAIAALKDAVFPEYDGKKIDYKKHTDKKVPINKVPIGITVLKIGDTLILDPTPEEEQAAESRLTVTTFDDGTLCAMQKGGVAPFKPAEIEKIIDLATAKSKEISKLLK